MCPDSKSDAKNAFFDPRFWIFDFFLRKTYFFSLWTFQFMQNDAE